MSDEDADELTKVGLKDELESIVELSIMVTALFDASEDTPLWRLIGILNQMDCVFLKSPDGPEFITSSFPFYVAWASKEDEYPTGVYFPLSPHYAAVLRKGSGAHRTVAVRNASGAEVISLNKVMMNGNETWVTLMLGASGCWRR